MKLFFILLIMSFSLVAENKFTVEQFKKIMKGKETATVREELKFFPIYKKASYQSTFNYIGKEPFKVSAFTKEKYVEGKYIIGELILPKSKPFYQIVLWNEKENQFECWLLAPDEKIACMIGKKTKRKNRISWEGETITGEIYKGYTDYSKDLTSWEAKYYALDGKLLSSESGNAVPVKE